MYPVQAIPSILPLNALEAWSAVRPELDGRPLAIFLDYDGTLSPIAPRPEDALLSPSMRESLRSLAATWPTTIVSGRSRSDVASRIGLRKLGYAGSHGFDILGPGPEAARLEMGRELAPVLACAAEALRRRVGAVEGVLVEEKQLSVSLHYRLVEPSRVESVRQAFEEVFAAMPGLRRTSGKMVLEMRPALDWDKGRAVLWLLDRASAADGPPIAVYIGDDVTDEDAFEALRDRGLTILVADEPRPTAARYSLRDTTEVGGFLRMLTGLRQRPKPVVARG